METDYNEQRRTFGKNFVFPIGRFSYTIDDSFYAKYKPGPNPPNQPKGYSIERVLGYPVICYYAGKRKDPIKRCPYAEL